MREYLKDVFKSNSGVSSKRLNSFIALIVMIVYVFVKEHPADSVVYALVCVVLGAQAMTVLTTSKFRR